jgi:hypothetical protein
MQRHAVSPLPSHYRWVAGSVRHLDEALHLAAMQYLGYRHVIATIWTINDSLAPQVADAIYTELTRDGSPPRPLMRSAGTSLPPSSRPPITIRTPSSPRPVIQKTEAPETLVRFSRNLIDQ